MLLRFSERVKYVGESVSNIKGHTNHADLFKMQVEVLRFCLSRELPVEASLVVQGPH